MNINLKVVFISTMKNTATIVGDAIYLKAPSPLIIFDEVAFLQYSSGSVN